MKLWYDKKLWISPRARRTVPALARQDVRSIAVIKHAALGDLVLTRPFLIELRRLFLNASITLAVERGREWPWVYDDLDLAVHTAPGMNTKGAVLQGIAGPFRTLEPSGTSGDSRHDKRAFDLLFDLTATPCSFWITRLTRAKLKLGFQHRSWHRMLYDLAVPRTEYKFEAEVFLDFLHLFGHEAKWPPDFGWRDDRTDAATERPDANRSRRAEDAPAGPVLYFPGASTQAKSWPEDSFVKLIREARARFPKYEHLIWPGTADWERERCARIASATGAQILGTKSAPSSTATAIDAAYNSQPAHSPISIARAARLYVGNDTGVRHVAIATDTPTIGFFRTAPPFRYTPKWGSHRALFARDGGDAGVEAGLAAMEEELGQAIPISRNTRD
ncbi:MAG: glycosyltransferase family 9 protein [Gemmatimonadetes bacterium]|nr:glycosyltransferase family 9 protein [Gemmatimonadota bacterium]